MKKGEKYGPSNRSDKRKSIVEEIGKRTPRTRIEMNFDPKTSKLRNQEAVYKYLAGYGFHLSPGIKFEFCPNNVDDSSTPPDKEGVYMHPLALALGLRLPMMKFVRSVLIFYEVVPSQLTAVA